MEIKGRGVEVKNTFFWKYIDNVDDGLYGDSRWNPTGKKDLWTATKWWFRNPLHNWTFYIKGFANEDRVVEGNYPERTFAPCGWNRLITKTASGRTGKYTSYCNKYFKCYYGYRPHSGAFGFKFIPNRGECCSS